VTDGSLTSFYICCQNVMCRPKFNSSVDFKNLTHIYETTHNDYYSYWSMLLLSMKDLKNTWKNLLKLWSSGFRHYAVLYVDTTILEKHATYEGSGPRRGVTIYLSFHGKLEIYCFSNPRSNSAFL